MLKTQSYSEIPGVRQTLHASVFVDLQEAASPKADILDQMPVLVIESMDHLSLHLDKGIVISDLIFYSYTNTEIANVLRSSALLIYQDLLILDLDRTMYSCGF